MQAPAFVSAGERSFRSVPFGSRAVKGAMEMDFWEFIWFLIWTYVFVAYLILLFHIFADVFRDRDMGGFAKAVWIIALVLFPFLSVLIYVIARGRGMAERRLEAVQQAQTQTEQYIQSVANAPSAADQIGSAKALLDAGTITEREYEQLKAKALA